MGMSELRVEGMNQSRPSGPKGDSDGADKSEVQVLRYAQDDSASHPHYCADCQKTWQHEFPGCAEKGSRNLLCPVCYVQRTHIPVARFCIEEAERAWREKQKQVLRRSAPHDDNQGGL